MIIINVPESAKEKVEALRQKGYKNISVISDTEYIRRFGKESFKIATYDCK